MREFKGKFIAKGAGFKSIPSPTSHPERKCTEFVDSGVIRQVIKANMALDFAATYKVLVLGDSNVGKTCIVHRYCDERYYDTYISTIGEFFFY